MADGYGETGAAYSPQVYDEALEGYRKIQQGQAHLGDFRPSVKSVIEERMLAADPSDLPKLDPYEAQRLQTARSARANSSIFDGPLLKPVEYIGSKLYQIYSATVSPAASFALLDIRRIIHGKEDEDPDDFMGTVRDLWSEAHKIGPGQSLWMLGLNNNEARERGFSPNQLTGANADEAKKLKDAYFSHGPQKWVTGTADFAVSWWADPLVLAGKAAGATRAAAFTKPLQSEPGFARKMARRAKGQRGEDVLKPTSNYEKYATDTVVDSMTRLVSKYKSQHGPDVASKLLMNGMKTFRESAGGDVLLKALMKTNTDDEIRQVLRVSMGDSTQLAALEAKNADVAIHLENAKRKTVGLGISLTRANAAGNTAGSVAIQSKLANATRQVAALDAESSFLTSAINSGSALDRLNYNRITSATAIKARNLIASDKSRMSLVPRLAATALSAPVRIYSDIRPSGYLDLHDINSWRELDASLREAPIEQGVRDRMVGSYINATPDEREKVLQIIEGRTVQLIASKYGMSSADADRLYRVYRDKVAAGQTSQRSYSAATMEGANGAPIPVAAIDFDGTHITPSPILSSQIANNHVVVDFRQMERAIKSAGSAFSNAAYGALNGLEKMKHTADVLDSYWKFAQLFRLGYGPRAITDDFLGQVARYGGSQIALRTKEGAVSLIRGTAFRSKVKADRASVSILREHEAMVLSDMEKLQKAEKRLSANVASRTGKKRTAAASQLRDVRQKIADHENELKGTRDEIDGLGAALSIHERRITTRGETFSGPYEGEMGSMFRDSVSGERNLAGMLGRVSDWQLKKFRGGNWENISATTGNEDRHMTAWIRDINDQIRNDPLAMLYLKTNSVPKMVQWLRTPDGAKHMGGLSLGTMQPDELARRVSAHVDHYLDPRVPGMDAIRAGAPKGAVKRADLERIPPAYRPMVNAENTKYVLGRGPVAGAMNAIETGMTGFYKVMAEIPSRYLLRNPLFAQLYRASVRKQMATLNERGNFKMTEVTRQRIEKNARQAALRDVKKFTFTMDHETKLAYHMKFLSAFFGSQQEAWSRWARILAEKPQTVGHAAQVYGSPMRTGIVVDKDGNTISGDGTVTDPETGKKKLVGKADMRVLVQVPEYLGGKKAQRWFNEKIGADPDAEMAVPMNTLNFVFQSDPVFLPSAGPWVQMATNHFVRDEPKWSDFAKALGVLPFGTQDSWLSFLTPNVLKKAGYDNEDDEYQKNLLMMMNVESFKYDEGMRETKPTWKELEDRADRYGWFKALVAGGSPFTMSTRNPYQFFVDEFRRFQDAYGSNADDAYYQKYGDSLYRFAVSMSKNSSGIQPTAEGYEMSKYYQDIIDGLENPELAGVVIGVEGDGEYSDGAYRIQGETPIQRGGRTKQREKMDAREAFSKAQTQLGWKQYNSVMDELEGRLYEAGFTSWNDEGAEEYRNYKKAVIRALTQPYDLEGNENDFFNPDWAKDFLTIDRGVYDSRARDLNTVVLDPDIWSKAVDAEGNMGIRSDIYRLRDYLSARAKVKQDLAERAGNGGSDSILANSNADLRDGFQRFTFDLVQSDTRFSYIHRRFFSNDMGYNEDAAVEEDGNATA